jgi:hypothetical protein
LVFDQNKYLKLICVAKTSVFNLEVKNGFDRKFKKKWWLSDPNMPNIRILLKFEFELQFTTFDSYWFKLVTFELL